MEKRNPNTNYKGNYNKERNTNNKRRKPEFVTLTRRVEGDDFKHAMDLLCRNETIYNIIRIDYTDETGAENSRMPEDPTEAIEMITTYFYNNTPDLLGKRNIHTSLNVSSNKAMLRTEDNISFGWYISYVVEDGHAIVDYIDLTITVYQKERNQAIVDDLLTSGWKEVEKRHYNK